MQFAVAIDQKLEVLTKFNKSDLELRIGVASGDVEAGIVGQSQISFEVWGDPVSDASALAEAAPPGSVLVAKDINDALERTIPVRPVRPGELRRAADRGVALDRKWRLMLGRSIFTEPWFQWGLGLVIGFPFVVILLGELLARLERRKSLLVGPVRLLRNAFIPLLVGVLFLQQVLEFDRSGTEDPNGVIQVAHHGHRRGRSGGAAVDRAGHHHCRFVRPAGEDGRRALLVDIVRFVLLGVGSLLILTSIWGLSITGTFAALGIGGLVIGLALQDTLASLMGGIAILGEKPFVVGDWIDIDGTEGKVTDINWRTVRMRNRERDLIVVPNIVFGNQLIINNSRPEIEHIEVISLGFSYDDPPNAVKAMLAEVVAGTPNLVTGAPLDIRCVSYDDFSIGYEVWLQIESYDIMPQVRNHFMTRVWYAAKRRNITIPFPIRTVHNYEAGELSRNDTPAQVQRRVRSLTGTTIAEPVASKLAEEQVSGARAGTNLDDNHLLSFAAGEVLQLEGGGSRGLGIILRGTAVGLRADNEVVTIRAGEVFGEQAMLGTKPNLLTIRALTDVEAIVISGSAVDDIARGDLGFAEEIQAVVQSRRAAVARTKLNPTNGNQPETGTGR